ncbi:MAG: CRISPR-associated endonuclease Cas2 [Rhodospirillaceae bacterium]|nr:CRISPR-associated endonuclease Cas2 [Rhodospirillaceae bacterium]MBT5265811.1 CRISPR-associated endonuclease Cas2 [Rhodospirillaceae bacterium]MBT6136519.1 CRISPR-associated endonuclease Cas2 [Rhodospirillaceae bacterium]
MWMMVLFDLPVVEPEERRAATGFRNFLKDQGFEMAQFSVYVRYTSGKEAVEAMVRQVKNALPERGHVDILQFTDKQYENIVSFRGGSREKKKNPEQFVLF